jgi:O-antigen ligase
MVVDSIGLVSADELLLEEPAVAAKLRRNGSLFERYDLTVTDVLLAAFAGLLCVAFMPNFLVPSWTPRMMLLLATIPPGIVSLGVRVVRREAAAMVAAATLSWAVVSGVASVNPALTLTGGIGRESSVLILVALAGVWSLGGELTQAGRRLIERVLIAGLGMSAIFGVLQVVAQIERGPLRATVGRASGLTTHPVYFGAMMSAGCALIAMTWLQRKVLVNVALLLLFSVAASLSGSRIALVSGLLVVGYAAYRSTRGPALLMMTTFISGNLLGVVLGNIFTVSDGMISSQASIARVAAVGGDLGHRLTLWGYGLDAAFERPLVGWGAGNFRSAVQGRYSIDFTREFAPNDRAPWFDAHNFLVEWLVGVGLVGLGLLVAFALLACRRCTGPLAAAAVAMALTWLLEPAALTTFPLVMLLIGASGDMNPAIRSAPLRAKTFLTSTLLVGLALSAALGVSDWRLRSAALAGDAPRIEAAARVFWNDPIAADLVASGWAASAHPDSMDRALDWSRRAVAYERDRAAWWEKLASRQALAGDLEGARISLERAVELQPWRPSSWSYLLFISRELGDSELERRAVDIVCELEQPECGPRNTDG